MAFLFGKIIGVDHPISISLLNKGSLFSNSCKLSVPCKDFAATGSLTTVRVCVRLLPVLPMLQSYADCFLKSKVYSSSLYCIHCFQKI